jgi:hypothetical protein
MRQGEQLLPCLQAVPHFWPQPVQVYVLFKRHSLKDTLKENLNYTLKDTLQITPIHIKPIQDT